MKLIIALWFVFAGYVFSEFGFESVGIWLWFIGVTVALFASHFLRQQHQQNLAQKGKSTPSKDARK